MFGPRKAVEILLMEIDILLGAFNDTQYFVGMKIRELFDQGSQKRCFSL